MTMEDPEGRKQERGGWTAPFWNDELEKMQHDLPFASDALLLATTRASWRRGLRRETRWASPTR
jgi:hypothetical protein